MSFVDVICKDDADMCSTESTHIDSVTDHRIERRAWKVAKNHQQQLRHHRHLEYLQDLCSARSGTYYMCNEMCYVTPYYFVFSVHPKSRWYHRTINDVLQLEYKNSTIDYYTLAFKHQHIYISNHKLTVPQPVSSDYIIQQNDTIYHMMHRHEPPVHISITIPIHIIYEDTNLLVVDKPSGIPVHPCGKYYYNTLIHILQHQYTHLSQHTLYPVHRLDRLTSGVLLIALNTETAQNMQQVFSQRQIRKQYVARVVGDFRVVLGDASYIDVNQSIAAAPKRQGHYYIDALRGKQANTRFEFVSYNGESSVVRCTPHTGVTHQIRVHLQHLTYPIINDINYGGKLMMSNSHNKSLPINDIIDDTCADCLNPTAYDNAVDATRHCTYIYLHAYKYSYQQHTFQSQMPDWARDDFTEIRETQ